MNAIVKAALPLWGLEGAQSTLIAARENAVFRVQKGATRLALRLHRIGYRSDAELISELHWMAAVAKGGVRVPAPVPALDGQMLHNVAGTQVDVLGWIEGETLQDALQNSPPARRAALFHALGVQMARLHRVCDDWRPPTDFARCAWDRAGLLGEHPLWDRFWENPGLSAAERTLFEETRAKADSELAVQQGALDYGLIHADLVSANVMVAGDDLHLIDFDDGGYGFRLFELATALLKVLPDPDYPALRAALCEGYHRERALDLGALDLMILLRALTYVGWNISRMHEESGAARNPRFIATARRLAEAYLGRSAGHPAQ